jgi:hypothetical protein
LRPIVPWRGVISCALGVSVDSIASPSCTGIVCSLRVLILTSSATPPILGVSLNRPVGAAECHYPLDLCKVLACHFGQPIPGHNVVAASCFCSRHLCCVCCQNSWMGRCGPLSGRVDFEHTLPLNDSNIFVSPMLVCPMPRSAVPAQRCTGFHHSGYR